MELYKIDLDILCPSYLFMANLFIDYIDAILTSSKVRYQNSWVIQKVAGHFNASVNSYQILMSHDFITPCELK